MKNERVNAELEAAQCEVAEATALLNRATENLAKLQGRVPRNSPPPPEEPHERRPLAGGVAKRFCRRDLAGAAGADQSQALEALDYFIENSETWPSERAFRITGASSWEAASGSSQRALRRAGQAEKGQAMTGRRAVLLHRASERGGAGGSRQP